MSETYPISHETSIEDAIETIRHEGVAVLRGILPEEDVRLLYSQWHSIPMKGMQPHPGFKLPDRLEGVLTRVEERLLSPDIMVRKIMRGLDAKPFNMHTDINQTKRGLSVLVPCAGPEAMFFYTEDESQLRARSVPYDLSDLPSTVKLTTYQPGDVLLLRQEIIDDETGQVLPAMIHDGYSGNDNIRLLTAFDFTSGMLRAKR